jgi:hypothetical protein
MAFRPSASTTLGRCVRREVEASITLAIGDVPSVGQRIADSKVRTR